MFPLVIPLLAAPGGGVLLGIVLVWLILESALDHLTFAGESRAFLPSEGGA